MPSSDGVQLHALVKHGHTLYRASDAVIAWGTAGQDGAHRVARRQMCVGKAARRRTTRNKAFAFALTSGVVVALQLGLDRHYACLLSPGNRHHHGTLTAAVPVGFRNLKGCIGTTRGVRCTDSTIRVLRPRRRAGAAAALAAKVGEAVKETGTPSSQHPSSASVEARGGSPGPVPIARMTSPKFKLMFTCKVCEHRNSHMISYLAYEQGIVIATCPNCNSRHLVSDKTGLLDYGLWDVEMLAQQGENVTRLSSEEYNSLVLKDNGTLAAKVANIVPEKNIGKINIADDTVFGEDARFSNAAKRLKKEIDDAEEPLSSMQ